MLRSRLGARVLHGKKRLAEVFARTDQVLHKRQGKPDCRHVARSRDQALCLTRL